MIPFLRRCYGVCLTVLGAVTGTPTQAKQAANLEPTYSCLRCGNVTTEHDGLHACSRPRINCGSEHERHPDPSRPAGGSATQRHGRGATVGWSVQVRPGRMASGRAWGDVSSSANAPADPADGGAA